MEFKYKSGELTMIAENQKEEEQLGELASKIQGASLTPLVNALTRLTVKVNKNGFRRGY